MVIKLKTNNGIMHNIKLGLSKHKNKCTGFFGYDLFTHTILTIFSINTKKQNLKENEFYGNDVNMLTQLKKKKIIDIDWKHMLKNKKAPLCTIKKNIYSQLTKHGD